MRALDPMRTTRISTPVLALILALGCQRDAPSSITAADPSLASARNVGATYTSTNLGVLPGDNSSRANGVNDAGEVAGYSCCSPGSHAFVRIGGALTALPGDNANALAISNGSTRYVAGWVGAPSQPVRWTIQSGASSQPTYLQLGEATYGAARAVNDVGQTVGSTGDQAAMWDADGLLTIVPAPAGFTRGEGRGINSSGHAVFVFSRPDPAWPDGIAVGYLRLATGEMIQLEPVGGSGISYANALTPVTASNTVLVAGTSSASPSAPRALRWTVDVLQQAIVSTEVRSETSHGVGISDAGAVTGFVEGPTNSLKSNAFRWQGAQLLSLDPPKSGKEGKGWAISPNGQYVAGEAYVQPSRVAILWRIASP
jgi:uncharacterized membrane protein